MLMACLFLHCILSYRIFLVSSFQMKSICSFLISVKFPVKTEWLSERSADSRWLHRQDITFTVALLQTHRHSSRNYLPFQLKESDNFRSTPLSLIIKASLH